MIAKGAGGVCQYFITGGISFNTAGSYAAKIFSSLVRGIILNKLFNNNLNAHTHSSANALYNSITHL